MLFAVQLIDRQYVALGQRRKFAALILGRVVHIFLVYANKPGENQHLAVGSKQRVVTAQADVHAGRVKSRRRHLAGQRALPDHLIEPRLVGSEVVANAVRRAQD